MGISRGLGVARAYLAQRKGELESEEGRPKLAVSAVDSHFLPFPILVRGAGLSVAKRLDGPPFEAEKALRKLSELALLNAVAR